jgi:hypothetical protein
MAAEKSAAEAALNAALSELAGMELEYKREVDSVGAET